jgi:hypothetical protein
LGNRCRETDQRAAPVTDSCHDREARYARQEADRGLPQSDPPMTDFDVDVRCVACGRPFDGDPDEEPDGEGPGRPLCGECNRARDFDTLFLLDLLTDGELDADMDP